MLGATGPCAVTRLRLRPVARFDYPVGPPSGIDLSSVKQVCYAVATSNSAPCAFHASS